MEHLSSHQPCLQRIKCSPSLSNGNISKHSINKPAFVYIFRSTTVSFIWQFSTPTKWHFAAHMGQLMRDTIDTFGRATGCSELWPQCPLTSAALMNLNAKDGASLGTYWSLNQFYNFSVFYKFRNLLKLPPGYSEPIWQILNEKWISVSREVVEYPVRWFNVIIILCVNTVEFTTVWFLLVGEVWASMRKEIWIRAKSFLRRKMTVLCFTLFRYARKM